MAKKSSLSEDRTIKKRGQQTQISWLSDLIVTLGCRCPSLASVAEVLVKGGVARTRLPRSNSHIEPQISRFVRPGLFDCTSDSAPMGNINMALHG